MSSSSDNIPEVEKTASDIVKNWFINSPTHGIRRISIATSLSGRVFWSTTFLAFTTLMSIFIYTVIVKYIANPTKINLSVKHDRDTKHFPAITFCNLNPLRDPKHIFDDLYRGSSAPTVSFTDTDYKNLFVQYMGRLLITSLKEDKPTIVPGGYKLNDLLIQCTFNGRLCSRNLTSFFHPNYGNCYTFNNDDHVEAAPRNDTFNFWSIDDENSEDGYKLFLELFLYQNEYIPYLDERAAFRLFIHRKDDIPILSQNSLFLAPATFTKLIFSQRVISFSQNCRDNLTDDMKRIFNSNHVRYSQALCLKLCEARYIEKICDCIDQLFMVYFQFFSQNNTMQSYIHALCSMDEECLENRKSFDSKQHCSECLPECEIIQYKVQSSFAAYPNSRLLDKVFQRVDKHLKTTGHSLVQSNTPACSNNRKMALLDNIIAVEISSSPIARENLAESPMYTWVDVISSIGGQAGLWIGVSLISFVEIAELIFTLLCYFIRKSCRHILMQMKIFNERFLIRQVQNRF